MKIEDLEKTTEYILSCKPDPVIKYLLLRDVLQLPSTHPDINAAKAHLEKSRHIQLLASEQHGDGSWGPFHSRDTSRKQKIITTEVGVGRGLVLGMDRQHPILQKAEQYTLAVLNGEHAFPDHAEKNNRWPVGMRLFTAATLALIHPGHPVLDKDRKLWTEIVCRTFASGEYDPDAEIQAHKALTGATVKDSYLVLDNRYCLQILGSKPGLLPSEIEQALLAWLAKKSDGIGYLHTPLTVPPNLDIPGQLDRWFSSLELLSAFGSWKQIYADNIQWILNHRNTEGLWDFGPRPAQLGYFPLSDTWRRRQNRAFDWTTRVMTLLRRALD